MRVIEPGHVYALSNLDGHPGEEQTIVFVNRLLGPHGTRHPGILNQEAIRAVIDVIDVVIDRVNSLDAEMAWGGNAQSIKHLTDAQRLLRLVILLHEQRALERKVDKDGSSAAPCRLPPMTVRCRA